MSLDFITYEIWKNAIELLEFQIKQKATNKHYRTLNIKFFETLSANYKNKVKTQNYFEEKIKSGIFYGIETEFFSLKYPKPKNLFGIRNYVFMSYMMTTLHYSIGLYLLKITQEIIECIKEDKSINSFYGGNLNYNNEKLNISKKNTYYLDYYKDFKKEVKKRVKSGKSENTIVLKIDVENYFDNISVKKLLKFIEEFSKQSTLNQSNYDEKTIIEIENFYKFVLYGKEGIPQSDNNIISGFLGYLYFVFADINISSKIKNICNEYIENYNIVRYVDDIYIILEYKDDVDEKLKNNYSLRILTEISDLLYYKFNLKINNKTKIFDFRNQMGYENLLKELKKVSLEFEDYISDEEIAKTPQEKLDKIIEIIERYNLSDDINIFISSDENTSTEIFKELFDPAVSNIINKTKNIKKIGEMLENINFKIIKLFPKPLMILMTSSQKLKEDFLHYIGTKKDNLLTSDVNIILEYLSQVNFESEELFDILKQDLYFKTIMIYFEKKLSENEGFYEIEINKFNDILKKQEILEQIRLRIQNEKIENYQLALNHLVNEFQSIIFEIDDNPQKNKKEYKLTSIRNYFNKKNIDRTKVLKIIGMFDRRNNNLISHSGTEKDIYKNLTCEEYKEYKETVKRIFKTLFV